jgi:RNA polymerase sigma-70 factor (ECF subfamily)
VHFGPGTGDDRVLRPLPFSPALPSAVVAPADHHEAQRKEPEDALLSALPSPLVDPEMALLRQTSRDEFREAFAEAVATLSSRERTLLRQHYVDGLQPGELGPLYGVHRTTALRWLQDASEVLVRATRRRLQARLDASPEDVDSLIRALGSQLDLSLRAYLA